MERILVVVDVQNDFVTGSLGTKEAEAIVPAVVEKVKKFDGTVVFTRDSHGENYMETQEGRNLPVLHCIEGTEGWEIISELEPYTKDRIIFDKPAFGNPEVGKFIADAAEKNNGELEVEIIGLCTDICVVSNVLTIKAFAPEVPLIVDSKCCAGVTPKAHQAALTTMKSCQVKILE